MVDQQLIEATVRSVLDKLQPNRLAYNLTEAAEATGVPIKQLRAAIARRELPAKRVGKSYLVTRTHLCRWLETP